MHLIGVYVLLLGIICLLFTCLMIIRCYQSYQVIAYLEEVPQPPTVPFLGNVLDLMKHKDIFRIFNIYQQNYGDIVKLFTGYMPSMLLISDSDLIKFITCSPSLLRKSEDYRCFSYLLGRGLFLRRGEFPEYGYHRKHIDPMFHTRKLEKFVNVFQKSTKHLLDRLKDELSKQKTDIYPLIELCCIDILTENTVGLSVNAQSRGADSEYVESLRIISKICTQRIHQPYLWYNLLYSFSYKYLEEWRAVKIIRDFVGMAINHRRLNWPAESETFLDLFLKENLDAKQMKDDLITFVYKGYGTVASAISFTLHLLAENPRVQEEAVTELKELFRNDKERPIVFGELADMRYLEAVIKEALRIYPSVPLFARKVDVDTTYGNITLPKGITLIINTLGIHRRADLFECPYKFHPERFRTESSRQNSHLDYTYFPFSWGFRRCVGERYAMVVIKYVLVAILREYTILPVRPSRKPHVVYEPFLKSNNGIFVRLVPRDFGDGYSSNSD